jgi:hypothetical protein
LIGQHANACTLLRDAGAVATAGHPMRWALNDRVSTNELSQNCYGPMCYSDRHRIVYVFIGSVSVVLGCVMCS